MCQYGTGRALALKGEGVLATVFQGLEFRRVRPRAGPVGGCGERSSAVLLASGPWSPCLSLTRGAEEAPAWCISSARSSTRHRHSLHALQGWPCAANIKYGFAAAANEGTMERSLLQW